MKKKTAIPINEYHVIGMHCAACEMVIEKRLGEIKEISDVHADLRTKKVSFRFNGTEKNKQIQKKINTIIEPFGYKVTDGSESHRINYQELGIGLSIALVVLFIFLLLQKLGIVNMAGGQSLTLPVVFLLGIIASISSCMAVVGGLVLSLSANFGKTGNANRALIFFHFARIISFFILGGVMGLIGAAFTISPMFYFIMSIILFLVMIILGMNLLDIFPVFQKLQIHIPKSFTQNTIQKSTIQSFWTPFIFGTITFFLPCGFTQSMQMAAIASSSAIQGSLIMVIFALGTLPVLGLISFTSVKLSQSLKSGIFFRTAGFIVLFFAIFNFLSALVSMGFIQPLY